MFNQRRADELIHEIGTLIVQSKRYQGRDWDAISIVVIVDDATQISGYTYDNSGKATAGSPGNFDINDKFEELCEAMIKPGARP